MRQLKKVIKIVHHLQNVMGDNGKAQPQMISRMVEVLANLIKPAAPTSKTADLIWGNAKNWGHTTMVILQDHYEAALEEALEGLVLEPGIDWRAAFEVAVRWARRNLPRLPRDVVDHAEALVTAAIGPDLEPRETRAQDPQPADPQAGNQPPQGNLRPGRRLRSREESSRVDFVEEMVTIPPPTTNQPASQRGVEQQTQTTREETTRQGASPPITPQPAMEEISLIELLESESVGPPPLLPPKEQRVQRRDPDRVRIEEEDWPQVDSTPTSAAPPRTITVAAQVLRDPIPDDSRDEVDLSDLGESLFEDRSFDLGFTPQPAKFGPTRHIRTDRKLLNWTMSVSKKWLLIGDSNLSRLPHHGFPDLQIDSFPGANFRHLTAVISKAVVQVRVEKVLVSCGLNSRGQKFKETTLKQLQTAVRALKRRFPYAEMGIALVNYSTALPRAEQQNLSKLNAHISKNMPYIDQLPETEFKTEADKVHWTKDTAKAMFDHWCALLNLKAP